ncbi:MAG: heterodisulfide reductase-related iron-sulfur binding cluster [Anaerolineales bacterium]|nr:heterodisulfide reductase-related iron-sulfur binding cluster [Anaerolineales bacterium]
MKANGTTTTEVTTIRTELAQLIQDELGQNVYLCYQCVKCTSGCPVGEYFDWQPNQVMRALQLGQEDIALHAQTPWLCASCQTCNTRCPQNLNIPAIMEFLARESLKRGIKPRVPEVNIFNQAFLRELRIWGRSYEPGLMIEMKLRNPHSLLDDVDLYTRMLKKMKVGFLPKPSRPPSKVKPLPAISGAIAYYPGCSLHTTATEFNISTQAVCQALDLNLVEPRGWVCCGSSAAHRADPEAALRLPMQNLSLIEQSGFEEVTMPCAACFNRHKAALHEIRHDPHARRRVEKALGRPYEDRVQVNTLYDTLLNHDALKKLEAKTKTPLQGLHLACYYGCLLTRPPEVTAASHPENPTEMDELMRALGAEVVDWSYKTACCGAAHSLVRPGIVLNLSANLILQASLAGAEAIVVACPLCHTNLDARQFQMSLEAPMPILYFTQLMAVALGLPERSAALHKNLVDPRPLLQEKHLLAEH